MPLNKAVTLQQRLCFCYHVIYRELSMQTLPGAEEPKVSMLIEATSLPVYLHQPKLTPFPSRLVTALGNTDSRYC